MMNIFNSAIFAARILNLLCHRFVPGRRARARVSERPVAE
jgi:hypothetical protein